MNSYRSGRKLVLGVILTLFAAASIGPAQALAQYQYPKADKGDVTDDYHGTVVADPYRWLEDTDAADTRVWIEAENRLTFGYLGSIPEREYIRQRLTVLDLVAVAYEEIRVA